MEGDWPGEESELAGGDGGVRRSRGEGRELHERRGKRKEQGKGERGEGRELSGRRGKRREQGRGGRPVGKEGRAITRGRRGGKEAGEEKWGGREEKGGRVWASWGLFITPPIS